MAGQFGALPREGANIPVPTPRPDPLADLARPKLAAQSSLPPLPAGFTLDAAPQPAPSALPPLPEGFTLDNPTPQGDKPKDRTFTQRYLTDPLIRGKNNVLDQTANVAGLLTGALSPEDFAKAVFKDQSEANAVPMTAADQQSMTNIDAALKRRQSNSSQFPREPADLQTNLLKSIAEGADATKDPTQNVVDGFKTAGEVLNELRKNPGVVPIAAVESAPTVVTSVAGGVGGGLAGGAAGGAVGTAIPVIGNAAGATGGAAIGAATGAGLASGATEFANSLIGYLQETGQPADEAALAALVQDPVKLAEAKSFALKRGISVGLFDALSAGMAGRFAHPIEKMLGGGIAGKIAGASSEALAQGAGGAGGEAAAQYATKGKIDDPSSVLFEALAEVPGAALEVPAEIAARKVGERFGKKNNVGATVENPMPDQQNGSPVPQDGVGAAGSPPANSTPSMVHPVERAVLRMTNITDEDIDNMSPEERQAEVEAALSSGQYQPTAEMVQSAMQYGGGNAQQQPTASPQSASPRDAARNMVSQYDPSQGQNERAIDIAGTTRAEGDFRSPAQKIVQDFRNPRAPQPEQQSPQIDPAIAAQRMVQGYDPAQGQNERAMDIAGTVRADVGGKSPAQQMIDGYRRSGTRQAPATVQSSEDMTNATQHVNTSPTDAQIAAGNYQKGHVKVSGIDVTIETPKGATRRGTGPDGKPWSVDLPAHYGYVKRTTGADGDQVDVYVGDNHNSKRVYVVDQIDATTRRFDEHKAIMGASTLSEAKALYQRGFSDGKGAQRIGAITPMSTTEFRKWLKNGQTNKPVRFGKANTSITPEGFPADAKGNIKKPESLIEYLAKRGGIRDEGGTLQSMGLTDRKTGFVQGGGPLVRAQGMSLDKARALAVEAGYLGDAGAESGNASQSYVSDLLDALDHDMRSGRQHFSYNDMDHATAWNAAQTKNQQDEQYGDQATYDAQNSQWTAQSAMDEVVRLTGLDPNSPFAQDVAEEMANSGSDFDAAAIKIERQDEEALSADLQQVSPESFDEFPDIPFFGDNTNGNDAGNLPETGATSGAESQSSSGSGQKEPASATGIPVQGNGQEQTGGSNRPGQNGDNKSPVQSQPVSKPKEEVGADGKPQLVMPGMEQISSAELAQINAKKPLKPKAPQKDPGGLFSDDVISPQFEDLPTAKPASPAPEKPVSEAPKPAETPKPKPSGNTIFTDDAADKARALIKAKLSGSTLNSGIDPELALAGFTIAGYHIEKGARTFAAYAKAMVEDFGQDIKPYLKGWYLNVKFDPRGSSFDGMSGAAEVEAFDISTIGQEAPEEAPKPAPKPETPAKPEPAPSVAPEPQEKPASADSLVNALRDHFLDESNSFKTIVQARKFLTDRGWKPVNEEVANKEAEEVIERAVVLAAREIVRTGKDPKATYDKLVNLYDRQPRLATRTSTSMADQAYSTPIPLAFVASRLADIKGGRSVFEPTAGNGALLIETNTKTQDVNANELNDTRYASLKDQGYKVTQGDATTTKTPQGTDRIIANPPFGAVRENGESKVFNIDGYRTTSIDQAIVMQSLDGLRGNGKAVFIIGGVKGETDEARADGYRGSSKRKFFKHLYDNFNVTQHFTVSGDLYVKQGAAWPVDVIVVDGRSKSALKLPAANVPVLVNSWADLKGYLDGRASENAIQNSQTVSSPVEPIRQPAAGNKPSSEASNGRPSARPDAKPKPVIETTSPSVNSGQPAPAGPRLIRSEPSSVGSSVKPTGTDPVTNSENREPHIKVSANDAGQVPYHPHSEKGRKLNSLVPAALGASMDASLSRLEEAHGSIDNYVAKELGYTLDELPTVFSAEQIDAIGLAIDNMSKGAGFIIGDQTGIGKGRVVAAAIRYAHRQGIMPIFVTEKPDLYGDMFRDMDAIQWEKSLGRKPVVFMTNAETEVPLDDKAIDYLMDVDLAKSLGQKKPEPYGLFTPSIKKDVIEKKLADIISGKFKPDVIFTNYSQMSPAYPKSSPDGEHIRRKFMDAFASQAFIIMDESHNAGGQGDSIRQEAGKAPPGSVKFRQWVTAAKSVMYSSATYAKNPKVMDLYSRTDMAKAVEDPKDLAGYITSGGVPLQQIISSTLARSGQYVRRERSFEGVEYNVEVAPVDQKSYEEFAGCVASIFKFDKELEDFKENWMRTALDENGSTIVSDAGLGDQSASSTNFASVMHNIVNQMVLSIKADAAADRAIKALEDGEKPVIALASTNENFLGNYAEENDIKLGDPIDIGFDSMVLRYLKRTLRVTIKDAGKNGGKDTKRHVFIPLKDLPPELREMYRNIEAQVGKADLSTLAVSPLDHIRNKIGKAGYSIREVTGRKTLIDYSGAKPVFKNRPTSELNAGGKRVTIREFVNGSVDAVILNKSGSTGISLHSSVDFKDQRRRRMILVQADPNIDTHMQMLGRVHRTGQVNAPAFSQLMADIPAEARPAAVLMRKMASLNANTTAARKSKYSSDAVDFMNKYGDMAAVQWAIANPDMNYKLGYPISFDDNGKATTANPIERLTGRIMLLVPEEQQKLIDDLTEGYITVLAQKEALGESALEAKTVDLDARPISKTVIKDKIGPSPFEAEATMELMNVKSVGRALKPFEVVKTAAESIGIEVPEANFEAALSRIESASYSKNMQTIRQITIEHNDYVKWVVNGLKNAEAKANQTLKNANQLERWSDIMRVATVGKHVLLETGGETPRGLEAIIVGVVKSDKTQSPTAASNWSVRFAIPDNSRILEMPFSQISTTTAPEGSGILLSRAPYGSSVSDMKPLFEAASKTGRQDRYIATGNVLAAYSKLGGVGQIVQFSDENGDIKPGVLMPSDFNLETWKSGQRIEFKTVSQIMKFLDQSEMKAVVSNDSWIRIESTYKGFKFAFNPGRGKGGKYFTDKAITEIYNSWMKDGVAMTGTVSEEKARRLIPALQGIGARFVANSQPDLASEIIKGAQFSANPSGWGDVEGGVQTVALTDEQKKTIEDIAKRVSGIDVNWWETIKHNGAKDWGTTEPGTAAGMYSPAQRIITLALDTATERTAYHEAFHDIQYVFLDAKTKKLLVAEKDRLRQIVELKNEKSRAAGMSQSEIEAEAFSIWADQMDKNEAAGIRLHVGIRKIWQKIRNTMERIKNALNGMGYQTVEDVFGKARSGETAKGKRENLGRTQDPQYMFAGSRAKYNDGQSYRARYLLENGEDPAKVYEETGWMVGPDGQLRFEISDDQSSLDETFRNRDISPFYTPMLKDILIHPELYDQYPWLKFVPLNISKGFTDRTGGLGGAEDVRDDRITIDQDFWKGTSKYSKNHDLKSIILHEVQHVLQRHEGFDMGKSAINDKSLYKVAAGEVEAKNTETRRNMNDAGRRASYPDMTARTPRDKIVVYAPSGKSKEAPGLLMSKVEEAPKTDTPAFKRWFGDSKIVKSDGSPMVFYHGTNADFSQFEKREAENDVSHSKKPAFFFTSKPEVASSYPKHKWVKQEGETARQYEPGANVIPVYLKVENPLVYDFFGRDFDRDTVSKAIKEARKEGNDGVVFRNMRDEPSAGAMRNSHVIVTFDPKQVKSTFNQGTFAPDDPNISFALAPTVTNFLPPGTTPANAPAVLLGQRIKASLATRAVANLKKLSPKERKMANDGELASDYLHRKMVDYLHPLKMLQERERGSVPLNDLNDAYLNARLAEDAALAKIQNIHETYVAPAVEELAKSGASLEDLHNLLYAQHAEERNRVIGMKNQPGTDMNRAVFDTSVKGASGWSTDEANAMIAKLRADPAQFSALERAADMIRMMLKENLFGQRRAGLISSDTYDLLTTQWQNYVPLKGNDGQDEEGNWNPSTGKGFDVRGDEFKAATGRFSDAENAVIHATMQAENSVIRQKKNDVGKAIYRFVNQFDPQGNKFAQVYWSGEDFNGNLTSVPSVYKREIGPDGMVRNKKVPNPFARMDDVIATKIGGKTYYIRFKDQKVGLAVRKMTTAQIGALSKMVRPFTTLQSIINTRANPAFIPINIIRDATTGAIHLTDEGVSFPDVARTIMQIPKGIAAVWRSARGRAGNGEWDNAFKEMQAIGGKINFDPRAMDFDQQLTRINKDLKNAKGDKGKIRSALSGFVTFIEHLNDAGEMGFRLATYKRMKDQGRTAKEAAFVARDITVDFKKHGEMGPAMNSWFVFFNAAMQGNYNVAARLAKSKTVRGIAASAILGGVLQQLWNEWASGMDDDGESYYDKLMRNEAYRLERQMLFFIPGTKDYVTFPLPYGYNAFWHFGVQSSAAVSGKTSAAAAIADSARVTMDAFNPIGSGSIVSMITPTIADPAVDLLQNQNFFGGSIYPSPNPFDNSPSPNSTKSWATTHPAFKSAAEWMNYLSGGDDIVPGYVDIHPDTLEYLWDFYTGGIGRFLSQTGETASRAIEGDFEPKKTPWVRSFYGQMDEQSQRTEYFTQREKIEKIAGYIKNYADAGDSEGIARQEEQYPAEIQAMNAYEEAEKARKRIAKQRRKIMGSDMTSTEKKQLLESLDEAELMIMKQARTVYARARNPQ